MDRDLERGRGLAAERGGKKIGHLHEAAEETMKTTHAHLYPR